MTYLVVGASGFLGSYFLKNIIENTQERVLATCNLSEPINNNEKITWEQLDITSMESVERLYNKLPSNEKVKVIYLSAFHHPDKVEEDPDRAWDVNVESLDRFLRKFKDQISTLYYSSTDYVYGESIDNYIFKENDTCCPVNEYGKTKRAAEQIVLVNGFNAARYPFLIGKSMLGNKPHFFDRIVDSLKSGNKIDMFEDFYRNVISFDQAAYYTIQLIKKYKNKQLGLINIASDKSISKYDVAIKIAGDFGFDKNLVIPISAKEENSIYKAKRACKTLMSNKKLKELLDINNIEFKL